MESEPSAAGDSPFVFFYRTESPFSNWHPCEFSLPMGCGPVGGPGSGRLARYNCVEQRMMHAKALLFGDHETEALIMAAKTPRAQKALGRKVRGFDEAKWERLRFPIVYDAVVAKFAQDPALLARLLAHPVDAVFVEASPTDCIWGIGLAAGDPRARDPAQWRGLNLLGKATSAARRALDPARPAAPPAAPPADLTDDELAALMAENEI